MNREMERKIQEMIKNKTIKIQSLYQHWNIEEEGGDLVTLFKLVNEIDIVKRDDQLLAAGTRDWRVHERKLRKVSCLKNVKKYSGDAFETGLQVLLGGHWAAPVLWYLCAR